MNAKKTGLRKGMKRRFLPALLLAVMIAVGTVGASIAYADILIWHSVHMKPGGTYNVGYAGWNTTVFIEKPGDYTLKGSSRSVRVLIECGGTNVYLADGLDINCSAHSYTGSRTAAIWVRDNGGTVKLISKKKAKITLEGYMCPGIRKEGTSTKLVFETEDPKNPGTIHANSGSYDGDRAPSAIGSMDYSTGNITFNSGNVIAKIRGVNDCGAAIGGAQDKNASNITVNGGHIEAYGSVEGTGIGAGAGGVFTGFYVNGGEVYAENDVDALHLYEGAAIGGGGNSFDTMHMTPANTGAKDFYIKGGKVTAISHGTAAAIGGGTNSGCSNINIEGGEVNATCDSKTSRYEYYGAGIGGGYGYQVNTEVNISGGKVTAKGGPQAPGIGSQDAKKNLEGHDKKEDTGTYRISGGTIYVGCGSGARGDIGTRKSKTIVTGGNLHAGSHAGDIVNGNDENVHDVQISFDKITDDGHAISGLTINPNNYSYGMKDVETMSGKLHAWLPGNFHYDDHAITGAQVSDSISDKHKYVGHIPFTDNSGTLVPTNAIVLKAGHSLRFGSAWAIPGETSLVDMTPPVVEDEGYKVDKYSALKIDDPEQRVDVANVDGTLIKNVNGYTDADGKWAYGGGDSLMFEAVLVPIQYQVKFDSNVPRNASTKLSGTMTNQEFTYGTAQNLSPNGYTLPGYTFNGWNTKAGGTGTTYTNKESVSNLTYKDGDVVTLYAQWTPKTYTITFKSGNPPGLSDKTQTATFDKAGTLTPVASMGWNYDNHALHGWTGAGLGTFYPDGSSFCNLCGPPQADGSLSDVTLNAEWVDTEKIKVSVTKDGAPQGGLEHYLFLIGKSEAVKGQVFTGLFKETGTGQNITYLYDPEDLTDQQQGLPEGTYQLCFDTAADTDAGISAGPTEYEASSVEISYGSESAVSTVFDYYTITITKDPAAVTPEGTGEITSAWISPAGGTLQPTDTILARDGSRLDMQSKILGGYHFDGYSVMGVIPGNGDNSKEYDPSKAKQVITVRGKADIMAHAEANVYTVHFDPNATIGISGEMEDQDMVYDQPQNLFANQFERTGAIFFGWNTKKDGSGTEYTNGERVENLTADSDAEVTLYALWSMITFNIGYDLDGGQLPAGEVNPDKYWADSETFTLINPEKKDYNFIGWMGTDLSEPTKTVTIEEGSVGDRKYQAVWELKTYRVNFVDNGGSGVEPQLVNIHEKATKPKDPTRDGYDFAGWYSDAGLTKAYDFNQAVEKDITLYAKWKPAKAPVLMAWGRSSGKKAVKASWKPVDGAAKYLVYAGTKDSNLKLVKETTKTTYTVKKIKGKLNRNKKMKAHKSYVFCVAAVDKNGKLITTSNKFHVITAKTKGKYANIKTITAKKKAITLNVGGTATVKAKVTLPKGKKHLTKKHGAKFRYTSDYPTLVSVSSKGQIKGLEPGTATIYIQDTGGKYCRVTVTVR